MMRLKTIFTFIIIAFSGLLAFKAFPQQNNEIHISPDGDTITIIPIPLLEINSTMEEQYAMINRIREAQNNPKNIIVVDTLLETARALLIKGEKYLSELHDDEVTLRVLDDQKTVWSKYREMLEKIHVKITRRISDLGKDMSALTVSGKIWNATYKDAIAQGQPVDLVMRIDGMIRSMASLSAELKQKQDSAVIIQNLFTDIIIRVDDGIVKIAEKRDKLRSKYFIQDSDPIWVSRSSNRESKNVFTQMGEAFKANMRQISFFFNANKTGIYAQLLIFILLIIVFYLIHQHLQTESDPEEPKLAKAKMISSRYISAAFFMSIAMSLIFYRTMPAAIRELNRLLYIVPIIALYSTVFDKRYWRLLRSVLALFILSELQTFMLFKTSLLRIFLLVLTIIMAVVIYYFGRKKSVIYQILNPTIQDFLSILAIISIILLNVSLLANVFGYVNLSLMLTNTIIIAMLTAIVLIFFVAIFDSLIVGLMIIPVLQFSNIIKKYHKQILKKLFKVVMFLAIFIWIRTILVTVGVVEPIWDWLKNIGDIKWEVGPVTITLGNIFGFVIVILVTTTITSIVKHLMEDELFPRIRLNRGVPGSISMIVRYTIMTFGIFIAISAAGIDLSQFGLIAGALGVGIGFGLQGIVYNFIAGLILAFERPVQVGDTIEIGTLLGDVKSIGVRSSTIRTYDGSEVIVPNGNLISNEVVNWTLSDRVRRRTVPVGVAYGTPPRKVIDLLISTVTAHPEVLTYPKPFALFEGFGESSLNFKVLFWVDFDRGLNIQSEVAMNIYDALEKEGINIPFPQRDLHVKSFDPTIQKIIFPFTKDKDSNT